MIDIDALDFQKGDGLVAVVTQDAATGAVLMMAFADREALEKTISTGEMHYRSRSRGLWHKGATSGNVQRVVSLTPDCDKDTVLAKVVPAGPACHTGDRTCFNEPGDAMSELAATIEQRVSGTVSSPSYTQKLLGDRNLRLKKVGEEAAELVVACADEDTARAAEEGADLFYHALVALRSIGVSLDDVKKVLAQRAAKKG